MAISITLPEIPNLGILSIDNTPMLTFRLWKINQTRFCLNFEYFC